MGLYNIVVYNIVVLHLQKCSNKKIKIACLRAAMDLLPVLMHGEKKKMYPLYKVLPSQ